MCAVDPGVVELNPAAAEWKPNKDLTSPARNGKSTEPSSQKSVPSFADWQGENLFLLGPEQLLGHWADSLGNAVHVFSVDAYQVRLMATLSQPPRPDIHLTLRPYYGGWICGNAALDPTWSSKTQLHWITADGRLSVWVRSQGEFQQHTEASS